MENYKYLLNDNNGAVYLDFEIKLSIGSKFEYLESQVRSANNAWL